MHIFVALFICLRTPFVCLLNDFTKVYSYLTITVYIPLRFWDGEHHFYSYFVLLLLIGIYVKFTGEVTCHDFGYGRGDGVPGPHPIHILGEVKKQTH